MNNILLIDDEQKIREVLESYFLASGFVVFQATNGKEAMHILARETIDVIILDLMLPDTSGEELCQRIRLHYSTPILMLTAKVTEADKLHGLSIGADDYIEKPFSPKEVVMRVKVILRRTNDQLLLSETITTGNITIYSNAKEVYVHQVRIDFTPKEYALFVLLVKYPNRVFSRDELVERVMGFDFEGDVRVIDQHVKNIRKKIAQLDDSIEYIETVYGIGYKFGEGKR
ncbi:response regulator transcription factor [Massilibacterium senegalense]|uniref:response regulator transcription factor n=1 Tax=Massilibacterium senegalense TaxID=1632858 RepID=UPI000782A191|nr:response regulator transcription factor [Massilibacterium senegalense]